MITFRDRYRKNFNFIQTGKGRVTLTLQCPDVFLPNGLRLPGSAGLTSLKKNGAFALAGIQLTQKVAKRILPIIAQIAETGAI